MFYLLRYVRYYKNCIEYRKIYFCHIMLLRYLFFTDVLPYFLLGKTVEDNQYNNCHNMTVSQPGPLPSIRSGYCLGIPGIILVSSVSIISSQYCHHAVYGSTVCQGDTGSDSTSTGTGINTGVWYNTARHSIKCQYWLWKTA